MTTNVVAEYNIDISSEFCRLEVLPGIAGFPAQCHRAEIKVLAGLSSHLKALGKKLLPSSRKLLAE